jgi:protocatechuate 3,4-dioxygenase beta subunit
MAALAAAGLVVFFMVGRGGDAKDPARPGATGAEQKRNTRAPSAPALAEPARVSGRVSGKADGAPIGGAIVHLNPVDSRIEALPASPEALTARTGADGAWSIDGVSPGEYRVSATADGFLPGLADAVSLAAGAATDGVDFALEPGGNRLSGVVSDVTGGPIGGAVVQVTPVHGALSIRDDHSYAAMTDAAGRYAVQLGDGRYRATASHGEYGADVDFVELRSGAKTLDFALTPGGVIEGVVVSEASGEPVGNARVRYSREATVAMPGGGAMAVGGGGGVAFADGDGVFRIRGLDAGAVRLSASAGSRASREPTTVSLGIAEHTTGVEVYVADAYSISGKVVIDGDEKKPAAGVTVVATTRGGPGIALPSEPSGADGTFRISGLPPGSYGMQTVSDEFVDSLGLGKNVAVDDADVSDVIVTVKSGAMISGHVEPRGIAEVGLQLVPESTMMGGLDLDTLPIVTGSKRTRDDGEFTIGPVKPGSVKLVARAGDGRKGVIELDVPADGANNVVITLEPKSSLSGKVVDADGKPVGDAMVALSKVQKNRRVMMVINGRDVTAEQSPTHEDGSFTIRGLDAGDYELTVRDRGGQALAWAKPENAKRPNAPISTKIGENVDKTGVTLRVEARNGVITGVAIGPDGSPAPDTWVTATRQTTLGGMPGMPEGMPGMPEGGHDGEGEGEGEDRMEVRAMVVVADGGDGDDAGGGPGGFGGLGLGLGGGSAPPALTDSNGKFEITGLRKGTYDLMAEGLRGTARGFERGVDTGSNARVELVALTRIDGKVTAAGKPVSVFTVRLSGAAMREKAVRDDGGTFSIHRIDPGQYTVEVSSADGKGEAQVTVVAGQPAEVSIDLASMSEVTGQVVDDEGNPVAGAMVLLGKGTAGNVSVMMVDGDEPTTTGQDGKFRMQAAAGKHLLIVMGGDSPGPLVVKEIEVKDGQDLALGTLKPQRPGMGKPAP